MAKFSYERKNPEYIKQQSLENAAEKIKQVLSREDFRLVPLVEKKLKEEVRNIRQEIGIDISENEILKMALEKIYFDQGGWPEKLKGIYTDFIADEVVNKVAAGEDVHKTLGAKIVELKRKGIEVDGKDIEERVRAKF